MAGVAAVWLLHIGRCGSCDVRGAGRPGMLKACGGLAVVSGWRRFGVAGFADPGGEDRKPVPAARGWVGVLVLGSWKAAATARGCAKRAVATRLLAGLRAKPPGIAAGGGLVLYLCLAVIMHVRAGAFGVIRVPAAYLGLSSVSVALATGRPWSSCRLTTPVVETKAGAYGAMSGGRASGTPVGAG
jgi:hypothetical protein